MTQKFIYRVLLLILMVMLPVWGTFAQNDPGLYVDAAQTVAQVSPYAYGANLGAFALPVDLLEEASQSGITFLRFPNGEYGDENNLRPNQIDLFISMAKIVGAEPSIIARLKDGTPEAAAELVRYTNIEKEYGVQYWYIGNEPTLYGED